MTQTGDLAVECLRPNDCVLTVSGNWQPVCWIGYRHVEFLHHPNRRRVLPVRVSANAFGPGQPARDLVLSPDHAVFVEDVLIPIRHLINGSTVMQFEADNITYYHVELPRHDVLFAEGLPVESYLEAGARDAFANGGVAVQLYPEFEAADTAMLWEATGYAPLVIAGEAVERARGLLGQRALRPAA
jgi:hypothetical protein